MEISYEQPLKTDSNHIARLLSSLARDAKGAKMPVAMMTGTFLFGKGTPFEMFLLIRIRNNTPKAYRRVPGETYCVPGRLVYKFEDSDNWEFTQLSASNIHHTGSSPNRKSRLFDCPSE